MLIGNHIYVWLFSIIIELQVHKLELHVFRMEVVVIDESYVEL